MSPIEKSMYCVMGLMIAYVVSMLALMYFTSKM